MDDGIFPPNTIFEAPPDLAMDLDHMDELLLEGCWLETTDGSEFLRPSPSNSSALFDSSFLWPTLEACNRESSVIPLQQDTQEERQTILSLLGQDPTKILSPSHSMVDLAGGSDCSRRWWIGPKAHSNPGSSVMDRLEEALRYIKDFTRNKDALIQIWVPVNRGGRRFLTTNDQPFSLDLNSPNLASYREISVNYQFPTEENCKEIVGLPGRVFKGKVPEWTPDVRFFRSDEYARVGHAQQYGVCGTLALPFFEQGSRSCLGVIEVVMTAQKVNYGPELESVCKALEAFDLRSSEVSGPQSVKACSGSYQAALPEILEVLRFACETHRLPLAQTWVPCIQQGKGGSRHSDDNYFHCVSTVVSACYVADPHMQRFHEACSEYHLLKGQGVVGQAFMTNQPCFSSDITSFTKTEYPLSHHARMFGLHAAVAIRLRSIYTGTDDFVLEFFLPVNCSDFEEQKKMLTSLSIIIRKVSRCLQVITDKELEEETVLTVDEATASPLGISSGKAMPTAHCIHPERHSQEGSSWAASHAVIQDSVHVVPLFQKDKSVEVLTEKGPDLKQPKHISSLQASFAFNEDHSSFGEGGFLDVGKTRVRRPTKAENAITLQILRQHFAGSLKDAAKSIGVCPTTLKRICRQNGIKRWPSRKIKKVDHSLQKLQLVIDSVQGSSGPFQIESFYSNFPELASPNLSRTSPFSTAKPSEQSMLLSMQPESGTFIPHATAFESPPSSCSQSSSSGQCCSSGTQPLPNMLNGTGDENPTAKESSISGNGVLKRVRSEVELCGLSDEVPKLLPRSQSLKSLIELPKSERIPPLPTSGGGGGKFKEGDTLRVKVTYGEERIRFRMQNNWGYRNLLQEIATRFSINDINGFHLKYLDDDSEWVLLTCDADLEECMDIYESSQTHTIKLALCQIPQQHSGSSFGSSSPL